MGDAAEGALFRLSESVELMSLRHRRLMSLAFMHMSTDKRDHDAAPHHDRTNACKNVATRASSSFRILCRTVAA